MIMRQLQFEGRCILTIYHNVVIYHVYKVKLKVSIRLQDFFINLKTTGALLRTFSYAFHRMLTL
jgi:hypothetical protein